MPLRLLLTVLLIICVPLGLVRAQRLNPEADKQKVEQISRARYAALAARDATAFAKYYAPDFQFTTAWGTREDIGFLERLIKTAPPGFKFTPSAYHVVLSADGKMAFATLDVLEEYPDASGGPVTSMTAYYTEIYVKTKTGWLLEAAHFSYKSKPPNG